jgi:hypothetical protein
MVDREAEIAAFIAANTFECKRFAARISGRQCFRNAMQRLSACRGCPDRARGFLTEKSAEHVSSVVKDAPKRSGFWNRSKIWLEIPGYPKYFVCSVGVRTRSGYKLSPQGKNKKYALVGPDKKLRRFTKEELLRMARGEA